MAGLIDALFPQPTPGGAPGTVDPRQAMWNQFASNMGAIVGRRPNSVKPLYGAYQKQQELNNLTRARELNNQIRQQQLEEAKQRRERETERLADLSSVMGGPPVAMGPPTAAGEMNVEPGTAPTMSPDQYFMRHYPEKLLEMQMKQDKGTTAIQNFQYLKTQGVPDQQAYEMAFGGAGDTNINVDAGRPKPPSGYWWKNPQDPKDYTLAPMAGGPATEPSDPERRAEAYRKNIEAAGDRVTELEGAHTQGQMLLDSALDWVGSPGQAMMSDNAQKTKVLQDVWMMNNLRDESGAVIGQNEMDQVRGTYFRQWQDSPAAVEEKRQARKRKEQSMVTRSGKAAPPAAAPTVGAWPGPTFGGPQSAVPQVQPPPGQDLSGSYTAETLPPGEYNMLPDGTLVRVR